MKLLPKQILIIAGGVVVLVLVIVVIAQNFRDKVTVDSVTLRLWAVRGLGDVSQAVEKYRALRPNVSIRIEEFPPERYEETILNALAAGEGPDVFMIPARALPRVKNRLAPADPAQVPLTEIRDYFPTVVEQDFVSEGVVYALPLYLDTLALFYNRDLFDQAGIVSPPKTWGEFQNIVPRLRTIQPNGQISRAAAAIGGTERTVANSIDLLYLLMLQNGAPMTDPSFSAATFAGSVGDPGPTALEFYLRFANITSPVYTWNEGQPYSLDGFASGKVAMVFGYQADVDSIKRKNPFVNIGIAPVPQPVASDAAVSYANYWGVAVSRQSAWPTWAWEFNYYLTGDTTLATGFAAPSGRPPALRELIAANMAHPTLSVFARQALTARSWYQSDEKAIKTVFNRTIESVLRGEVAPEGALRRAQEEVSQLMQAR